MVVLDGSSLTLEDIVAIADRRERIALAPEAAARVRAAREIVDGHADGDVPVYGVNTGFGSFAEVKIPASALETLQRNLVRSHAAGVGDINQRGGKRAAGRLHRYPCQPAGL